MLAVMQSDAGVRFELKRESLEGGAVRYGLTLELSEKSFAGTATIHTDTGAIDFAWPTEDTPPDWCREAVRAQLRTLFREGATGKAFPRRVTRWRGAPPEKAPG
jgi:hypothetical protein